MIKKLNKHSLVQKRDTEFYLVWLGKRRTWEVAYFNSTDDILNLDLYQDVRGGVMAHILEYTDNSDTIYIADTEIDVDAIIGVKEWNI